MDKTMMVKNSQTIGPYRIISQLGQGGMGEVCLALDERLERYVAIKRIQNQKLSSSYQKRFRREAKLIARLNHPAIVQIYDVIGDDCIDALVMEYVDGFTLKDLLESKKFTVQEALELTITLAQGLAAAHEKDIIHRDLKCSNILISKQGEVKITDFGIAKNFLKSEDDISITLGDELCFSYSSLSPEQALGDALDIRTDIFSLGVILFQLLTGIHPFDHGDGRIAQLYRLVNEPHPHLGMLVGEIPILLEELVDDMLAKQPILRPSNIQTVLERLRKIQLAVDNCDGDDSTCEGSLDKKRLVSFVVDEVKSNTVSKYQLMAYVFLFAVVMVSGFLLFEFLNETDKIYIAVIDPVINDNDIKHDHELIKIAVHQAIMNGVMSIKDLVLINPDYVKETKGDLKLKAKALRANDVITSQINCKAIKCYIRITKSSGEDLTVLGKKELLLDADGLLLLNASVVGAIQDIYSSSVVKNEYEKLNIREEDYASYLEYHHRYSNGDTSELISGLENIIDRSPGFVYSYYLLAEIYHKLYLTSKQKAWVEKAENLLQRGEKNIGDHVFIKIKKFDFYLIRNNYHGAEKIIEGLKKGWEFGAMIYSMEAKLYFERGDTVAAIEVLENVKEIFVNWYIFYYLALYKVNNGMLDEAITELDSVLELYPNNQFALGLKGDINLIKGNFDLAINYFEMILTENPDYTTLLNISLSYLVSGQYDKAYQVINDALKKYPDDIPMNLMYADVLFLTGDLDNSLRYYQYTIELVHSNKSKNWQIFSIIAQCYARLGNNNAALNYIQQALIQAPDNSQVAYEAALVFAIVGDENSAIFQASRAIEMGYSKNWFQFPWFDSLWQNDSFTKALNKAHS